jgi:hypothetical protein
MLHCVGLPTASTFIATKAATPEGRPMPVGLSVAFALFAQAAMATAPSPPAYGPAPPPPPQAASAPRPERQCVNQNKDPNGNEIVVCAVKPEGYRIPPDIAEARRLKKQGSAGPPGHQPNAGEQSCARIGPMGCRGMPTVNLLAVAATAAEISQRLAKGQEVGSIFQTEKTSSDYKLYLQAKAEREAREAQAAAKAAKAKAEAAAQAHPVAAESH